MANIKSDAWDHIGGLFWTHGRTSAKLSEKEVTRLLQGVPVEANVCIVGASSKALIETTVARGANVVVLDFSERMCLDLRNTLGPSAPDIRLCDITTAVADDLWLSQDFVFAERLINRFFYGETLAAISHMSSMLSSAGELRCTIRIGYYPMDLRLIEEGTRLGICSAFYDESTRTLDYGAAAGILESCLVPHGTIPKERLLKWYLGRGREKRWLREDLQDLFDREDHLGRFLSAVELEDLPDADHTVLVRAKLREG
jgi:hypothetical protein